MGKNDNNVAPTPEDLQKKVAELNEALAAEANSKKQLQDTLNEVSAGQSELAEKVADLTKENEALTSIAKDQEKQLEELNTENESLKEVNDQLSKDLASISEKSLQTLETKLSDGHKKAAKLSTETFEMNAVKYGFRYPSMMYQGKRVTNDDVMASEDLQKELVDAKHSMIKVVE